jgi:predicted PurR-regulated permease PerM
MQYVPILTVVISVLSLLLALYTLLSRNNKENTTELTTVIVKLENIGNGISDIKAEIANMKNDQKEDHDRLIKVESSVSSLWKQFNDEKHLKD